VSHDPLLPSGEGHTPIDDVDGLRLTYITTRDELNEAEEANITRALDRPTPTVDVLLDDLYLRNLHRAMFSDVWTWAGTYRTLLTTPGIDPIEIASAVRNLVADAALWVRGPEPADRVAVRFHHRLVSIHPFPNGNGRHARFAADLLQEAVGDSPFTWGRHLEVSTGELRATYLGALRRADRDPDDLEALERFART